MRPGAKDLLSELLPRVGFEVAPGAPLDPLTLFHRPPRALWLEIGFGGGEHLAALAAAHPDVGFLGVEPFINGVAKLLRAIEAGPLVNVRILKDDARLLLEVLPAASLERAYVLFPDPWPKLRHHKRRIVNGRTLADLARVVRPGGELRLATDDDEIEHLGLRVHFHRTRANRPRELGARAEQELLARLAARVERS